jgi:hypothetical protein
LQRFWRSGCDRCGGNMTIGGEIVQELQGDQNQLCGDSNSATLDLLLQLNLRTKQIYYDDKVIHTYIHILAT